METSFRFPGNDYKNWFVKKIKILIILVCPYYVVKVIADFFFSFVQLCKATISFSYAKLLLKWRPLKYLNLTVVVTYI